MATQDISQLIVDVQSRGIQTAATQLDKLAVASDKAERAVKRLGTSVTTPASATSGVTNAINSVNKATSGTTEALRQKAIAQKRDVEMHNAQVRAYAQAHAEALKMNATLDRKTAATNKAANAVRGHNDAMREGHALARGLSGSLGALWMTYGNLAGMAIGVALGASLKGVVTIGADVEHTLEKVRVLGQASNEEIAQMGKLVTELGQGAQGPRDVAQAFSVLTLAGLNAKEAMRGVGAALNLAVTGDVSVEKASETLVQVATALGYTSKSFDHIGDVIAKTAAVSMSSVESISASFMSAAASGEVYGARLEDMALGLAALANLGIKATAAGTAQKNFYKDLSSGTGKTTQALKMMGLALDDLKNPDGKFIPMYDIIMKMDEGLGKLSPKVRTLVMDMANGERGIKQSASLIGLLYQDGVGKAGEAISKLKQMKEEIADSAAFSSMAAMAMSQTTLNQMKAVGNTLQSSFVDVFKSVSPEISAISRQLKEAFKSDDFKKSLTTLVVNLAILTKALVDNGRTIVTVIAAVATLKIGLGLVGGTIAALRGSVIGIAAVKAAWAATTGGALVTSLARAGIAVRLFQASLGPLGLAIAALTTLWVMYENSKQKAIGKPVETENLKGMVGEISEQVKKEQKELGLRKRALAENTTYEKLLRGQEIEDQRKSYDAQIQASDKAVTKLEANAFRRGAAGATAAKQARAEHNKLKAELDAQHKLLVETAAAKNAMDDAEAQRLKSTTGTIGMPEKVDKSAVSERYYTYIQTQEQVIAKARADMDNQREVAELQRRSGLITELDMVYKIGKAESEYNKIRIAAIAEEARIAGSAKGKGADVARYKGELDRAKEEQAQSQKVLELKVLDASFAAHEAANNAKIKSEEKLGNFKEAAELKWGATNKKSYEEALQNAQTYGGVHLELVKQFEAAKAAAIAEGALKEEVQDFDIAIQRTQNTLKAFKTNTVGKSFVDMWKAAEKATKRYNEELVEAQKEYQDLRDIASKPEATDSAIKEAEEAMGRLLKVSDNFRQMWVGTGEQIAKGLEQAFGETGKTIGELVKVSAEYQVQKDKSFESDMAHYGNLAGAASGFFEKQSKGYKVLNSVSQAFHILSMARTLKETAANVAAAASKFFAQSGWGGFAGVAAMGAVMAGLGYAMSGSGGSGGRSAEEVQKDQGTAVKYNKDGSRNIDDMVSGVFGDAEAKSESVSKSLDMLKSNSDFMLPLTQAMKNSLVNIEASMTGLSNLVLRTAGVTDGSNLGIQTGKIQGAGLGSQLAGGALGAGVGYMAGAGFSAFTALGAVGGPIGMAVGAVVGAVVGKLWGSTKQAIVDSGIKFEGTVADLQAGKGYEQYASVDTTKKSFFGLSKKTTNKVETAGLNEELSSQFGLIFSSLETALATAGPTFGKTADEVSKAIDGLTIDASVSLKDLKGQDLTDAINGVISKTLDQIAEAAFPEMGAFRQVGEGYSQTVIRVAAGVEQANLALEGFGVKALKFTDITNKTGDIAFEITKQSIAMSEAGSGVGKLIESFTGSIEEVTKAYQMLTDVRYQMNSMGLGKGLNQDTIKGAGGADKLASATDSYFKAYFSKAEQLAIETTKMTEQFGSLGMALPASREQLRTWIEAAASAGDQTTVGKLLSLTAAFDDLMGTVKETAELDLTKIRKFMELLGLGSGVSKVTVDAAGGLEALSTAMDGYYAGFFSATERVGLETKRVTAQFAELGMSLPGSRGELRTWIETAASAGDQKALGGLLALTGAFGGLMDLVKSTDDDLVQDGIDAAKDAYDEAMKNAEAAYESLERAISKEKDALKKIVDSSKDSISALKTVLGELDKAIKSTSPSLTQAQKFSDAMASVGKALNDVRGGASLGKMNLSDSFEALSSDDSSEYSTLFDFQRDQAYANSLLKELKDSGENQLTEAEKALEAAEKQIAILDSQLEFAKSQLDALKGIDTSVQTVSQALDRFATAVTAAQAAKVSMEGSNANTNAGKVEALYNGLLGRASDEAGKAYWVNAMETGTSLTGVTQGITGSKEYQSKSLDDLYKTVFNRTADEAGKEYWLKALEGGTSISQITKDFYNSDEYKSKLPSFDVGTNYVPEDMMAMVHKGERIIPAADNAALDRKLSEKDTDSGVDGKAAIVAAINSLEASVQAGDAGVVQKLGDVFKILRDWDGRGTPPEREVE